jgi:membrane fusion protein, copper/silver efflux system
MRSIAREGLRLPLLLAAIGGGWLLSPAVAEDRPVLYYQDPTGRPFYSPGPKKDAAGRDYLPVYDDAAGIASSAAAPPSTGPATPSGERKILYYRNPMGLPDTSPVPKKDWMGMDYIPVHEGEEPGADTAVTISPAKVQRLGVRTEPAAVRELTRTVRAVGTVQADERREWVVSTKFDGWIERLHVNSTGQKVRRGEPLMEVYAPELVAAQREYLLAWRSLQGLKAASEVARASAEQLADAALERLKNWDISADQLLRLQREGTAARTLTLRAPASGVVVEKMAVSGMRFAAGDPLYRLADLSTVWLVANVFEQDLGAVREGQRAKATVTAYPGAAFTGTVSFVYPSVSPETRTAKVRIEIANPDGRLKTDMSANVELTAGAAEGPVLAVPDSAVLNSGTRQVVLVDRGEGRFEPKEVTLGAAADGYYEVRSGLDAGDPVVVGANFLIDAEANLRAALQAFTPPSEEGKP